MIFFVAIRQSDVDDVREVLDFYRKFEDPIEAFRENQRKLQVWNFSFFGENLLFKIFF